MSTLDLFAEPRVDLTIAQADAVEWLLSLTPGSVDLIIGSGSTMEAVRTMGRRFAGCDVKADAVRLALERAQVMS